MKSASQDRGLCGDADMQRLPIFRICPTRVQGIFGVLCLYRVGD